MREKMYTVNHEYRPKNLATYLVQRIINNQPYHFPDFSSAALSSINDATASPHSSALHMKKSFCVIYLPGKSKKLNVVQSLIPKSILLGIKPDTNVVLVFDTDVTTNLDLVKKNIGNIKKYCHGVKIIYLLQVKNLEEELVRCTDVKSVMELTKSKSLSNFKADFRRMKQEQCRHTLERHKIDVGRLWTTATSDEFDFAERNSAMIKQ